MSRIAVACLSLLLLVPVGARAEEDALPIIRKAFEAAEANSEIARLYVFHERVEERRFNKKDEEKKQESKTWDVTLLEGSEYRQLIAVNDGPLDEKTSAKEQKKLDKQIRKMQKETPKQRERRLAKVEKRREEEKEFLEEITKAFDFRLTGEEEIDGIPAYIIRAEPKEGYEPGSREAKVLTKLRGTLWISKADHAWVKADMDTFGDVSWAGMVKLRQGTQIRFTQRRLNDEVWLPHDWYVRLRAKAVLVYNFNGEFKGSYSNYRKFTTGSKVVDQEAMP